MAGMGGATFTGSIIGWRARNDDGSETAATWKAPQDTYWRIAFGERFRLRFIISRLFGELGGPLRAFALHESYNEGTFSTITYSVPENTKARPEISSFVVNSDDTTLQLSSETIANVQNQGIASGPSNTLATATMAWQINPTVQTDLEVEYVMAIDQDGPGGGLSNGDTIEYRVRQNGSPMTGGYSVLFILVVVEGGLRIKSGGTTAIRNGTVSLNSTTKTTLVY